MSIKTVPKPLVTTNQWFIVITVLLALSTSIYSLLIIPLVTGLSGLLFKKNPMIILGSKFLQKPKNAYEQEDFAQLQFNQTIAVSCLALSLLGFYSGMTVIGYVFSIMVGTAALIANFGFCIGCFIRFQWNQYQYRKNN